MLSLQGRDTIWLVADRRLSFGQRRPPRDDAVKILILETTDGRAILGYAGLGATQRGMEPSAWMSAVLRGRSGLTLEQSLSVLFDAASRELPAHLVGMPEGQQQHLVVGHAFIRDVGRRYYQIGHLLENGAFGAGAHHVVMSDAANRPPRLGLAGTGGLWLAAQTDWQRSLLSLANGNDKGKVSDEAVADRLAELNARASRQRSLRNTVGSRSIVVWRRRPGLDKTRSGGGQLFYDGVERAEQSSPIPLISNGADLNALFAAIMPVIITRGERRRTARERGDKLPDDSEELSEQLNAATKGLPEGPDPKLR